MTGSLGNNEFCFPRISLLRLGKQNSLSLRDQSLSVKCTTAKTRVKGLAYFGVVIDNLGRVGSLLGFHFYDGDIFVDYQYLGLVI